MLQYRQLADYADQRVAELLLEAHNERLAVLAARNGRPGSRPRLRARIAQWLIVAAGWIEGPPEGSIAHAKA